MVSFERPTTGASTPVPYDKPLPPLRTGSDQSWDGRRRMEIRGRHHTPTGSYDDKPLPPIMDALNAPLQGPRKPNMSLFSLFSRPKVQKSRGYAESGMATPMPLNDAGASRSNLDDGMQTPRQELPRSTSSMSFRTHRTNGSNHRTKHATARRVSQDHRTLHYDPPPLFQAFAKSTKNGLVEVSTASPEIVMAKSRTKRIGALQLPPEGTPRLSTDTSRSGDALRLGRFASRTSGSMSVTHVDVERKIFVLVTTGHLLQYSEYGPSGRLPEKVLVLNENSAAFASDLISGRPYVAQISQEVDVDGVPVAPTGTLFSKVGIKSAAEKKLVSNVLLVLPDGDELNTWLSAIRKQIEEQGGPPSNSIASTQGEDEALNNSSEHQAEPAPMQRYHIRRASSRADSHITDVQETIVSPVDPPQIAEPTPHVRTKSRHSIEEAEAFGDLLAAGASYTRPTTSAEEDETFGDILAAGATYNKPASTRGRSPSDTASVNSSVAHSVDHLRLNSLRSSVRMSTNTNVTGWTSRTNSMTSETVPNKLSLDSPNDAYGSRGPYRNLSSYGSGNKRRSAMPKMVTPQVSSGAENDLTIKTKMPPPRANETGEDSPVMGWSSSSITALPAIAPRGKVLSSRQSMPLLTEMSSKHDSKIEAPPPISEHGERPQSFVADLPSSAHWTTKLSTGKRSSKINALPTDKQMQRMSSAPSLRSTVLSSSPRTSRRNTSQAFNLPLKINPSGSPNSPSWQNSRQMQSRKSPPSPESDPETPLPRIHTLTAQISDTGKSTTTPTSITEEDNIPHNPPRADAALAPSRNPTPPRSTTPASAPKRLSIFPSVQPNPVTLEHKHIPARVRPPSLSIPSNHQAPTAKRPISIQIRTDSTNTTPFLSSLQNPKGSSRPTSSARSFTPPIRSLKPSRPGSSSASRSRASLPALDLGIPVVGLGPPAPPPSAPLPLLPTVIPGRSSRAASPAPSGLGLRIG